MKKCIDYVVPMVFPDDERWQNGFARVNRHFHKDHVRFRSWGTERLLIKLVKKNLPFLRDIIILLARESQKQPWMDEENVRVVYHEDFIPSRFLPTFNSRAIEMFLHRIPIVSDRFLYGNDDMFPVSPLMETDFFRGETPCIHMVEKPYPTNPNLFHKACLNGQNFVASFFGKHYDSVLLKNGHSIAPIPKKTCEKLWEIGGRNIENSITPFREIKNYNQYIYAWWHFFSGDYVDKELPHKYLSVKNTVAEIVNAINTKEAGVVCINDNECAVDCEVYARPIRQALKGII